MPSHIYRMYTPLKTKVDPELREKIKDKISKGYACATKNLNRKIPAKKHIAITPPAEIENFASALWHELAHALNAHQHKVRICTLSIDPKTGSGGVEIGWAKKCTPHQSGRIQAEISQAGVYAEKLLRLDGDTLWAVHDQFEAYVNLTYGEVAADEAQKLFLHLYKKQIAAEEAGSSEKIADPLERTFSVLDQVLFELEHTSGLTIFGTKHLVSLRSLEEVQKEFEKIENKLHRWFLKNESFLLTLVEECAYNFAISADYSVDINQIIENLTSKTKKSANVKPDSNNF